MTAPVPVINDVRGLVARQPAQRFARRPLSQIAGVVFHQELGPGDVYSVAKYHTSKECHIAPGKGCPSICYTYFIDTDGSILWCNDLEDVTWSQGGGTAPIHGTKSNTNYLAVVFRGDFTGPDHVGKSAPTDAQLASGAALWRWLRGLFSLPPFALFGHCDFGKPACPGDDLMKLVTKLRAEPDELAALTPNTVEEWQRALTFLRYDLGTSGPMGDGIDGDWGAKSQAALVDFQVKSGIPRSGARDLATSRTVATTLHGMGVTSVGTPPAKRKRSAPKVAEELSKEE